MLFAVVIAHDLPYAACSVLLFAGISPSRPAPVGHVAKGPEYVGPRDLRVCFSATPHLWHLGQVLTAQS